MTNTNFHYYGLLSSFCTKAHEAQEIQEDCRKSGREGSPEDKEASKTYSEQMTALRKYMITAWRAMGNEDIGLLDHLLTDLSYCVKDGNAMLNLMCFTNVDKVKLVAEFLDSVEIRQITLQSDGSLGAKLEGFLNAGWHFDGIGHLKQGVRIGRVIYMAKASA